jgi:hypothetical protein
MERQWRRELANTSQSRFFGCPHAAHRGDLPSRFGDSCRTATVREPVPFPISSCHRICQRRTALSSVSLLVAMRAILTGDEICFREMAEKKRFAVPLS